MLTHMYMKVCFLKIHILISLLNYANLSIFYFDDTFWSVVPQNHRFYQTSTSEIHVLFILSAYACVCNVFKWVIWIWEIPRSRWWKLYNRNFAGKTASIICFMNISINSSQPSIFFFYYTLFFHLSTESSYKLMERFICTQLTINKAFFVHNTIHTINGWQFPKSTSSNIYQKLVDFV